MSHPRVSNPESPMTNPPQANRRRTTLIKRDFQFGMILSCAAVVGVALVVQGAVMAFSLNRLATALPTESLLVLDALPSVLFTNLLVTGGLLAPLVFALGLRYSHRIAGPLHRIESSIERALAGEEVHSLKVRDGDQLVELAALVERLLVERGAPASDASTPEPDAVPGALPAERTKDPVQSSEDG